MSRFLHVAVCAQYLEALRIPVLLEPLVQLVVDLLEMLSAATSNMVDLHNVWVVKTTIRALVTAVRVEDVVAESVVTLAFRFVHIVTALAAIYLTWFDGCVTVVARTVTFVAMVMLSC